MKALTAIIAISLIFLLTACSNKEDISPVSPQVNPTSLSKAHPVPFNTTYEAVGNIAITGEYSAHGVMEGSGNAIHVGKYTSISQNDLYYTSATSGIVVNGTHTTYAASGDEMYATYSGTFAIADGIVTNTIDFVFNGGTGRFENLYGELKAVVTTEDVGQLVQHLSGSGSGYIIY